MLILLSVFDQLAFSQLRLWKPLMQALLGLRKSGLSADLLVGERYMRPHVQMTCMQVPCVQKICIGVEAK